MTNANFYLYQILEKYKGRDIQTHSFNISFLKADLKKWADACYIEIINSGSYAKGTAVSNSSDIDLLVSLKHDCNENSGGLKSCYDSLHKWLSESYSNVRKQNVSVRVKLSELEIDITPARKLAGNTNDHNWYVSKKNSVKKTNIKKHISDISLSGRTNEIKLLKIWREINGVDFPSIYLEYLLIKKILINKPKGIDSLSDNLSHVFYELAKLESNPLFQTLDDPANSNNRLSELLTEDEKIKIILKAEKTSNEKYWNNVYG